jgi:predicted dehydrogenase
VENQEEIMKRVLQIGAGGWGGTWLEFINDSPDWELAGLVSRGGSSLKSAREKWSITEDKCFTDLDTALNVEADLVIVTTPHHLHAAAIRKAVKSGKHVLCEKPLTDSMEEAKEIVAYAKEKGRILGVSQNFRFREGLWQLQAASAGKAGRIDSLAIELLQNPYSEPEWRCKQSSPIIMEIMIHHVDMARFLLAADAKSVFCRAWNPSWSRTDGPCNTTCIVEFENGVNLTYVGSWATHGEKGTWEGSWRVQFENGSARWDGNSLEFSGHKDMDLVAPAVPHFPGKDRVAILRAMSDSIDGKQRFPTDGEDNLKSLGILFAAIKSFQENRVVEMSEIL